MREEKFYEPQQLGLHRLTGDNTGLFYTNERTEQEPVIIDEVDTGNTRTVFVYDVYEVSDARDPHKVKNDVIENEHPFGDETKILRKTLAKVLKAQGLYDTDEYSEFRQYNEFCESV